jgi:hypothetical protein
MSTVKQNDPMSWKERLDALEGLHEEGLDKNQAWERLHERLKKKPSAKNIFYWMAGIAACLLLLPGIKWFNVNEVKNDAVTIWLEKPLDKFKAVEIPIIDARKNGSVNRPFTSELKSASNRSEKKISANHEVRISLKATGESEEGKSTTVPGAENVLTAPPDTIAVVVLEKSPKKLKVVHINELGSPAIEKIKLAKAPVHLQSGFSDDRTPDFFSNNANDNFFKIKLSPHN